MKGIKLLFDDTFCCIEDIDNDVVDWRFNSQYGGTDFYRALDILLTEKQHIRFTGDTVRSFIVSEKKISECHNWIEANNIKV